MFPDSTIGHHILQFKLIRKVNKQIYSLVFFGDTCNEFQELIYAILRQSDTTAYVEISHRQARRDDNDTACLLRSNNRVCRYKSSVKTAKKNVSHGNNKSNSFIFLLHTRFTLRSGMRNFLLGVLLQANIVAIY